MSGKDGSIWICRDAKTCEYAKQCGSAHGIKADHDAWLIKYNDGRNRIWTDTYSAPCKDQGVYYIKLKKGGEL